MAVKVSNMVSPKTGVEVANQFVIEGDGVKTFQSYNSTIAVIDWNEHTVKIGEDWNYSMTTSKYRNSFFDNNYFSDMKDTKSIKKVMAEVDKNGFALTCNSLFNDVMFTVTRL